MTVYPCAKINIGLNIVSKRPDGYHNLETIFYPIGIYDELTVSLDTETSLNNSCSLQVDGLDIYGEKCDNLVVKAYNLLSKTFKLPSVKALLTKRIPMQAGLGGGSADCAYMIRVLNDMFNLNMSVSEMQVSAAKLGADCSFFIKPVPSYAEGIGEKLTPVNIDLSLYKIVIVKPQVAISTKTAFAHVTPKNPRNHCLDIVHTPIESWRNNLVNDFENSIVQEYTIIGKIRDKLYSLGAVYASMSGSGSALFGIFRSVPADIGIFFSDCSVSVINGRCPKSYQYER